MHDETRETRTHTPLVWLPWSAGSSGRAAGGPALSHGRVVRLAVAATAWSGVSTAHPMSANSGSCPVNCGGRCFPPTQRGQPESCTEAPCCCFMGVETPDSDLQGARPAGPGLERSRSVPGDPRRWPANPGWDLLSLLGISGGTWFSVTVQEHLALDAGSRIATKAKKGWAGLRTGLDKEKS